jgi:cyanate lyase
VPVLKKQIELEDGSMVWVRQASGLEKIKIESLQAKAVRQCRDFGSPTDWTIEQNEQFLDIIEGLGGSLEDQMNEWVPNCILEEDFDINKLTSNEMRTILGFVRGDDPEGAIPLESSPE